MLRFAPSPNGRLHLGHAYSALFNMRMARDLGAQLFLRIDDTDLVRCTPLLEQRMLEDLDWLGLRWHGDPIRQSDRLCLYEQAISELKAQGLIYPAFMSRRQVREIIELETASGAAWPVDPDGVPHYPSDDRKMDQSYRQELLDAGRPHALRLNLSKAVRKVDDTLSWREEGLGPEGQTGNVVAEPAVWGDIVLSGKDIPASYHLANVVDDALMGITHVVRGRDLFHATAIHRLLQELLGFNQPTYVHHDLILDEDGQKLSKSRGDTSIAELRAGGATPEDIRKMVGL